MEVVQYLLRHMQDPLQINTQSEVLTACYTCSLRSSIAKVNESSLELLFSRVDGLL